MDDIKEGPEGDAYPRTPLKAIERERRGGARVLEGV